MAPGTIGNVLAAERVADFAIGQIAPHAGGRFQAEGAAAGEQDAVHLIGHVAGAERVDLLGAAGAAADIHAAHSALLAQNRGAAGDRVEVRNVTHANARNVGKSFHGWRFNLYGSIGMRGQ